MVLQDKVLCRHYGRSLRSLLPVASSLVLLSCGSTGGSTGGSVGDGGDGGGGETPSGGTQLPSTSLTAVILGEHLPASGEVTRELTLIFEYWKGDSDVRTYKQKIILSETAANTDPSNGSDDNAEPLNLQGTSLFLYKIGGVILYEGATPIVPVTTKNKRGELILSLTVAGEEGTSFRIKIEGDNGIIATGAIKDAVSSATALASVKDEVQEKVNGFAERKEEGFKIVLENAVIEGSANIEKIWFEDRERGDVRNWEVVLANVFTLHLHAIDESASRSDLERLVLAIGEKTYVINVADDNAGDSSSEGSEFLVGIPEVLEI